MPPWRRWPPPTPCATTPRPSTSTPRSPTPIRPWGIDLAIGLGTAQRQTGDPAFRDTLLDAARRAADLGDTDRLVAAALANDRGFFSTVGIIDAEKVAVLEMALDRLPADDPDRALVLATLCAELDPRQPARAAARPWPTRRSPSPKASGDDAIMVRVLNHVSLPAPSAIPARASHWSGPPTRWSGPSGSVTRCCSSGRQSGEATWPPAPVTSTKATVASDLAGALAEQLHQPTFSWTHTNRSVDRSLIAGDTDRAEQLANEALQIGIDSGQPDATVFYGGQLLYVVWQRGAVVELIPFLDQLDADMPDVPHEMTVAIKAMAHADAGQLDEARQLLSELAAAGFDFPMDMNWTLAMVYCAEAAIECRDSRYAGQLFDHLARGPISGPPEARLPKAPSATTSVDWPPFSVATARPTPTSPKRRPRAPERAPSSSPPAPTCLGAGCRGADFSWRRRERRAGCSPKPTRPQWPMDIRRCSDVLRRLSTP